MYFGGNMYIGLIECLIFVLLYLAVLYIIALIQKKYYDKTFYKKLLESFKNKKSKKDSDK